MSLVKKLLSNSRLRAARAKVANDPSVHNYLELAREHVTLAEMVEVQRVCREALDLYPANPELARMLERARQLENEDRTRELYRLLREAPRQALYRELCELLLSSNRVARAEECAQDWYNATGDSLALWMRAQARVQRFFADKRRDDGRIALDWIAEAKRASERDERLLRLELSVYSRIGAWREAREVASVLLEIEPGDPMLEARFRTMSSLEAAAPTVDQALRQVEKNGRFADETEAPPPAAPANGSVRPKLKELVALGGVQAAVYVRGSTALVQGPKGATAERHARAMREVVQKSGACARRLGLGTAVEVTLEGDFGNLLLLPGEQSSGALWCAGQATAVHREGLAQLAGIALADGETPEHE